MRYSSDASTAATRLPKPRYSLATLLLVMTAVAVLLWAVPEWREYRRRMEFEQAIKQLKFDSGSILSDLTKLLPPHARARLVLQVRLDELASDNNPSPIWNVTHIECYAYHRRWYAICFCGGQNLGMWYPYPPHDIRVYRMAAAPRDYQARATGVFGIARNVPYRIDAPPPGSKEQYIQDFYQMITGREKSDLGIRYELIHADPPLPME